jgi:two-component sensor histidine kinase
MPLRALLREQKESPPQEDFDPASEAHHRIANNLSLLAGCVRLQASTVAEPLDKESVQLMLAETAARIGAVGQLHRMLSQEPHGEVDLGEQLELMCAAFQPFVSMRGPMELLCDLPRGCRVRSNQIVPIAMIVTEMITNAIKYSHPAGAPGRIEVGCQGGSDHLAVEVRDDGVGLPENFDPQTDGGLGFKVLHSLAAQLGATPVFDSSPLGLCFQLRVPKKKPC